MMDGIVVYYDARGKCVGNHLLKKVEKYVKEHSLLYVSGRH